MAAKSPPRPPRQRIVRAPARPAVESEASFRTWVCDLATVRGWRWCYFPDSRRLEGVSGIPDLILVRGTRLLFVELKTDVGRVRPGQREWLADLAGTGAETHLWRPRDREAILTALS